MKKVISNQPFPAGRYNFLEVLEKGTPAIAKYRSTNENNEYLFYEYIFKALPERVRERIVAEQEEYRQYSESEIAIAKKGYLYDSDGKVKLRLRIKCHKSRTLEAAIKGDKFTQDFSQVVENMVCLAQLLGKLHGNGHQHGCVRLSNIILRRDKGKLILGVPRFPQIEKWRSAEAGEEKPSLSREERRAANLSPSSDVWFLGLVFLQMLLREVLPENLPQEVLLSSYLSKVEQQNFRLLIQLMLAEEQPRLPVNKVVKALLDIQQDMALNLVIPFEANKFKTFKFSLFENIDNPATHQLSYSDSVDDQLIQIKRSLTTGEASFLLLRNKLTVLIFLSKSTPIFADLSRDCCELQESESWFRPSTLQSVLKEEGTRLALTTDGCLQISCLLQQIKQIEAAIFKAKEDARRAKLLNFDNRQFNKCCRVKGSKWRSGFILCEDVLITSACDIKELKASEHSLRIESSALRGNNIIYDCWFAAEEAEELRSSPHLKFCLIDIWSSVKLAEFDHYLKLIKNYSEKVMEKKVTDRYGSEIEFNYQLGSLSLMKGDIVFEKESFIVLPEVGGILSGEPLRINFSNMSSAIIGMYQEKSEGILFNNQFYFSVYHLLTKCRTKQTLLGMLLPFTFTECSQFEVDEGQIATVHSLRDFMTRHSIVNTEGALAKLEMLRQEENYVEMGICNFLLQRLYLRQREIDMALYHLQMANDAFSVAYPKDNILRMAVYLSIADMRVDYHRATDSLGELERTELTSYCVQAINYMERTQANPFDLLKCYQVYLKLQTEVGAMLDILATQVKICKKIGFSTFLLNIYDTMMKLTQFLPAFTIAETKRDIDLIKSALAAPRRNFDFEARVGKTQKCIQNQMFEKVNTLLEELYARLQMDVPVSEQKEGRLNTLWKSAYMAFMAGCQDKEELDKFEELTKKYQEEGYAVVRGSFRDKEKTLPI